MSKLVEEIDLILSTQQVPGAATYVSPFVRDLLSRCREELARSERRYTIMFEATEKGGKELNEKDAQLAHQREVVGRLVRVGKKIDGLYQLISAWVSEGNMADPDWFEEFCQTHDDLQEALRLVEASDG